MLNRRYLHYSLYNWFIIISPYYSSYPPGGSRQQYTAIQRLLPVLYPIYHSRNISRWFLYFSLSLWLHWQNYVAGVTWLVSQEHVEFLLQMNNSLIWPQWGLKLMLGYELWLSFEFQCSNVMLERSLLDYNPIVFPQSQMRKSPLKVNLTSLTGQTTTTLQRKNQTPESSPASITTAVAVGMTTGALICTSASTRWRETVAMGPSASWTTLWAGAQPPVRATGLRTNQRVRSMVRYLFIYF